MAGQRPTRNGGPGEFPLPPATSESGVNKNKLKSAKEDASCRGSDATIVGVGLGVEVGN